MNYRETKRDVLEQSARVLGQHRMKDGQSQTWHFRHENGCSAYAFSLTWSPGYLTLGGDCGELTLVHWHALWSPGSIGWALAPDFDYLLSKTNVQKEFDRAGTLDYVLGAMRDEPRRSLIALRDERREYRRALAFETRLFDDACLLFDGLGLDVEEPEWWEFEPEAPEVAPYVFHRKSGYRTEMRVFGHNASIDNLWHVPDGWDMWVRGYLNLFGRGGVADLDDLMKASVRRQIRRDIADTVMHQDRGDVVDLLQRLGFDDYYGSDKWPRQAMFQIAVIQHGVRMILGRTESTWTPSSLKPPRSDLGRVSPKTPASGPSKPVGMTSPSSHRPRRPSTGRRGTWV